MEGEDGPAGGDGDPVTADQTHVEVVDVVGDQGAQEGARPPLSELSVTLNLEHGFTHSNLKRSPALFNTK